MVQISSVIILVLFCSVISSHLSQSEIDEFYLHSFKTTQKDKRIEFSNNEMSLKSTLPANTTLFKLKKNSMLVSCVRFPYKELLSTYISDYLFQHQIPRYEIFSEAFLLIYQMLYYSYGNITTAQNIFKEESDLYQFNITEEMRKYIDIIQYQSSKMKYQKPEDKLVKKYINKFNLKTNSMSLVTEVYRSVLQSVKRKGTKAAKGNILQFIDNKEDFFVKAFFYINQKSFPLSYDDYVTLYKENIKEVFSQKRPFSTCIFLSPITDLIKIELNKKDKFNFYDTYPLSPNNTDSSLLLYTKQQMDGKITKYLVQPNENIFFDYEPELSLKTDFFLKLIRIRIPVEVFEKDLQENRHLKICKLSNLCDKLLKVTNDFYYDDYSLVNDIINPKIIQMGKLATLKEIEIYDAPKFSESILKGETISVKNDLKAFTWYLRFVFDNLYYSKTLFVPDTEEQSKKEYQTFFKIAFINYNVLKDNADMLLTKLENYLFNEINNLGSKLFIK